MHRRQHRPQLHLQPHLRPLETLQAGAAAGELHGSVACERILERKRIRNEIWLFIGHAEVPIVVRVDLH